MIYMLPHTSTNLETGVRKDEEVVEAVAWPLSSVDVCVVEGEIRVHQSRVKPSWLIPV